MIDQKLLKSLDEYIALNYIPEDPKAGGTLKSAQMPKAQRKAKPLFASFVFKKEDKAEDYQENDAYCSFLAEPSISPESLNSQCEDVGALEFEVDESFSQCLLRMIDERNLSDPEVYNAALIDRRLFSKIRSGKDNKPKKRTVFALIIAMKLNIKEAEELLEKAGYAFSPSILGDVIVKYFIVNGNYDFEVIDQCLLDKDQVPLRTYE